MDDYARSFNPLQHLAGGVTDDVARKFRISDDNRRFHSRSFTRTLATSLGRSSPVHLAPIRDRLALRDEPWLKLLHVFRRKSRRAAGPPESLKKEAEKHGCRKMYGIGHSRAIFEQPPRSSA